MNSIVVLAENQIEKKGQREKDAILQNRVFTVTGFNRICKDSLSSQEAQDFFHA